VRFECYSKCSDSEYCLSNAESVKCVGGWECEVFVHFECYSKCGGSECLLGAEEGLGPKVCGISALRHGNVLEGPKGTELARLRQERMPLPAVYADAVRAPLPNE
jgi:hypothetical protein